MPYAASGETSIYYDTYGEPGRPAIVFAHGAGGNAASWWQQVPVFDPLFPPAVLESVANDIGAPLVQVAGAGHSTYFEKPEEFNSVVRDFLDLIG